MSVALQLLVLEDDPFDAELEIATLEEAGYVCQWERVETRDEFLACLDAPNYDIVLADYNLPTFDGLTALRLFLERGLDLPFILVSGTLGEETATESLKAGATDYVLKDRLARLGPVVKRALREYKDRRERQQVEEALQKNQQLLNAIIDNSPAVIQVKDLQGRYILINHQIEKIFGLRREEIIGRTPDEFFPQEIASKFLASDQDVIQAEAAVQSEYVLSLSDGIHTFVVIKFPLLDAAGTPYAIAGISTDITERRQAEKEREQLLAQIQEQAQRVQQIMDTVPEGVILLDTENCVVLTNPLGEKDLVTLADAQVGDSLAYLGDKKLTELLTSPPQSSWHEIPAKDRIFQVMARPIEVGPIPSGWVLVVRDMTHQREIEERVYQQERLAAVGQLAAGIAHDFNNIMATIVLYAQMTTRTEGLPNRVRERMETINQQAQHAARLIQQILDFSRRSVLKRQPLDLLLLLEEQVKLLERTLPENIEIALDCDPAEYVVDADPTRMQQMFMNLAVNARDAMPDGGKLSIRLERMDVGPGESPALPEMEAGEWIQVAMSDTGTGIPQDVLPHIFDPFFTTKGPGEGSGLGLAQVHGIVGQHGGRVSVESEMDKGTTFTVCLPALPVHPVNVSALVSSSPTLGQGEIVLVVEDETPVRKALVESLESLNYRVLEAENAKEALVILEARDCEVALVLSDVVMPEMGGIALFHTLREKDSSVPVVLLTGHPADKALDDLYAQGLSAWLPKPPSLEQLAHTVTKVLSEQQRISSTCRG